VLTDQEDVLLGILAAALSDVTFFRTHFHFDRYTEQMFRRLNLAAHKCRAWATAEDLFRGRLCMALKGELNDYDFKRHPCRLLGAISTIIAPWLGNSRANLDERWLLMVPADVKAGEERSAITEIEDHLWIITGSMTYATYNVMNHSPPSQGAATMRPSPSSSSSSSSSHHRRVDVADVKAGEERSVITEFEDKIQYIIAREPEDNFVVNLFSRKFSVHPFPVSRSCSYRG
jgi:hypothetical protein